MVDVLTDVVECHCSDPSPSPPPLRPARVLKDDRHKDLQDTEVEPAIEENTAVVLFGSVSLRL